MVMKVGTVNSSLLFRNSTNISKPDNKSTENKEIKELASVAPDYNVKLPTPYKKIGIETLPNGLKIHSYKLANGYRVSIVPMEDSPAVVKNYVNIGSMNETDNIKGISHFLEHMAFNGTNGREGYLKLNQGDSFTKIDEMGGWTNASTNYALTDYVNSTPMLDDKDLETQIKIIAAMTEDLSIAEKMIEKEKFPVTSEINMILDKPETIVIDQTLRTLFGLKSSADDLVGGSVKHVLNLSQKDLMDYYNKYYVPENMNLVITGDVDPDKTIELVSKNFRSNKKQLTPRFETKLTPINSTVRKDFISDKATSTDIMIGFAGPQNNDIRGQILFEAACSYLKSTDAGINKSLIDLNAYPDIGIEKISTNPNSPAFIYYAFDCADYNSEEALKTFYHKLNGIKPITQEELKRIKENLLIKQDNMLSRSINVNTLVGTALFDGGIDYLTKYDKILNDITPKDVDLFIKQYFDLNKAAITLVHPKKADNISFKGASRTPMNMDKVDVSTLNNNMDIAFYETKSKNPFFNINFYYELPQNIPAGQKELLDIILSMGTKNLPETVFNKYIEKNNIMLLSSLGQDQIGVRGASSYEKFINTVSLAKDQVYNPAINDENLELAKQRLKDGIERCQKSSEQLYMDNESKINPLYSSKSEILNNLDNITVDDLKNLHRQILNNSYATISVCIPQNDKELKNKALEEFSKFKKVQPNNHKEPDVYKDNLKTQVLTEAAPYSQADIMETFKYKRGNSIKEYAVSNILNLLLSSSNTIGLFNNLREKEHLAYSVYSDLDNSGNCGELSLHILTTTDNKEIGEVSYDNLQKAINGFNKQIEAQNEIKQAIVNANIDSNANFDKVVETLNVNKNELIAVLEKMGYSYEEIIKMTASQIINAIDNNTAVTEGTNNLLAVITEQLTSVLPELVEQGKITNEQLNDLKQQMQNLMNEVQNGNISADEFYNKAFEYMTGSNINQQVIIAQLVKNGKTQQEANNLIKQLISDVQSGNITAEEAFNEIKELLGNIDETLGEISQTLKDLLSGFMSFYNDYKNDKDMEFKLLGQLYKNGKIQTSILASMNETTKSMSENITGIKENTDLLLEIVQDDTRYQELIEAIKNIQAGGEVEIDYQRLEDMLKMMGLTITDAINMSSSQLEQAIKNFQNTYVNVEQKQTEELQTIQAKIDDLQIFLSNNDNNQEIIDAINNITVAIGNGNEDVTNELKNLTEQLNKLQQAIDAIYKAIGEQAAITNTYLEKYDTKFDGILGMLGSIDSKLNTIIANQKTAEIYLDNLLKAVADLKEEIKKLQNEAGDGGSSITLEQLEELWKQHDEANFNKYKELIENLDINVDVNTTTIEELLKSIDAKMEYINDNSEILNQILAKLNGIDWSDPDYSSKLDRIIEILENFKCNCECGGNNEGILGDLEDVLG